MTAETRTRQLARSTIIVVIAFGAAKLISLAQTFLIANVFGVGAEWAAYVTANRIPEIIFTLIAGGALAHAFIPIFSGYLARNDTDGAWRIASHVVNTIFCATFVVSLIVFLIAPWLVANVVAPGFDEATSQQTVELMRILLVSTLIFSVSGIMMGILQSHNHFLSPALAPIMFDVGILAGVIFLMPPFGVRGIALGAVFGAALHLGIQLPALFRVRARWTRELGLRDPVLWRVIRLMLPRVAGLGVFSLNFLIMTNIASRLGTAPVAALDWGWRLMQIPQTLIGTAIGTVIFPTLAALSEVGDERGKREALSGALRVILLTSIPASVGIIFVGRPLISLLERGAFDAAASALVYNALSMFALGIVVHSALEVVARGFYADKDTLTPLWAALGGAAINFVLAVVLSGVTRVEANGLFNHFAEQFPGIGVPADVGNVGGLALANSLGVTFEVLVLLWILRRRWHGADESAIARTVVRTLAASLLMALAIVLVNALWTALGLAGRGLVFTVIQIGLETGIGLIVFIVAALLLQIDEIHYVRNRLIRRRPVEGTA
ncbi:MAG: murein biosynthesis integral membrane protein MurJ [Anaerolineae bacterium]|nr:murein biosynthesis integral membrane protein MurJ [Anaerolineae bacterium]